MIARATVINIHAHGATVRLEDGTLAAVPGAEYAAHSAAYTAALRDRTVLALVIDRRGRHPSVAFPGSPASEPAEGVTVLARDGAFEERIDAYLRATHEWAPADRPDPAQRHFIRKKRRAAFFEARNTQA